MKAKLTIVETPIGKKLGERIEVKTDKGFTTIAFIAGETATILISRKHIRALGEALIEHIDEIEKQRRAAPLN